MVGNCQPALVLTKEDIELHFNINMIGVRGARGRQAENRLQAKNNKREVKLILFKKVAWILCVVLPLVTQ